MFSWVLLAAGQGRSPRRSRYKSRLSYLLELFDSSCALNSGSEAVCQHRSLMVGLVAVPALAQASYSHTFTFINRSNKVTKNVLAKPNWASLPSLTFLPIFLCPTSVPVHPTHRSPVIFLLPRLRSSVAIGKTSWGGW